MQNIIDKIQFRISFLEDEAKKEFWSMPTKYIIQARIEELKYCLTLLEDEKTIGK